MIDEKKDLRKASSASSLIVLLFEVIVLTASIAFGYVIDVCIPDSSEYKSSVYDLIVCIIQYIVVVPIIIFIFKKVHGQKSNWKLKDSFCKPQAKVSDIIKWLLISLSLVYIATYISSFLLTIIQTVSGTELNEISLVAEPNFVGVISNIVGMFLLAPIFEEIMFRGTFFKSLEKYGTWFSIIITGVIFGLWHINIGQTLYAVVLGICTAFLIAKTKSLVPSIILHATFNLIGTTQSIVLSIVDVSQINDENYVLEHMISIILIGLIGILIVALIITGVVLIIIELCKHKETFQFSKSTYPLHGIKKLAVYFSSPITIITYIILIALTVYNAIP